MFADIYMEIAYLKFLKIIHINILIIKLIFFKLEGNNITLTLYFVYSDLFSSL